MGNPKRDRQKAARAGQDAQKGVTAPLEAGDKVSLSSLVVLVQAAEKNLEIARLQRDRALVAALEQHTKAELGRALGVSGEAIADRLRRATAGGRPGRR